METRITRAMQPAAILDTLRQADGYYLCNSERDVSQSDFKNRLMPMTSVRVAPYREAAGFFSVEVSGGASVHMDLMRRLVNPFQRLRITRKAMPQTLLQTVCRGASLFGYRHYPENVIRLVVREFARYVDVWRVYDFLNHVPNMIPVFEEVQRSGRLLMPSICFSTGQEHTDAYYVAKVREILAVTGPDVIISIKNYAGLGTPKRIGHLVESICAGYPRSRPPLSRLQHRRQRHRPHERRGPGRGQDLRRGGSRLWLHLRPGPGPHPDPGPGRLWQKARRGGYPRPDQILRSAAPGAQGL